MLIISIKSALIWFVSLVKWLLPFLLNQFTCTSGGSQPKLWTRDFSARSPSELKSSNRIVEWNCRMKLSNEIVELNSLMQRVGCSLPKFGEKVFNKTFLSAHFEITKDCESLSLTFKMSADNVPNFEMLSTSVRLHSNCTVSLWSVLTAVLIAFR